MFLKVTICLAVEEDAKPVAMLVQYFSRGEILALGGSSSLLVTPQSALVRGDAVSIDSRATRFWGVDDRET